MLPNILQCSSADSKFSLSIGWKNTYKMEDHDGCMSAHIKSQNVPLAYYTHLTYIQYTVVNKLTFMTILRSSTISISVLESEYIA